MNTDVNTQCNVSDSSVAFLDDRAFGLLQQFVQIESTAASPDKQARLAEMIAAWLVTHLDARLIATPSFDDAPPLIHAVITPVGKDHKPGTTPRRRVLMYQMYDVMPATDDGWVVPPFEGGFAQLDGIGKAYVGRGVENNKGPLVAMLLALEATVHRQLDVEIEILIEGQEECGSVALRRYLAQAPCPVRPTDVTIFPSLCEYGGGPPRVYLGFSGLCSGELTIKGGAWGGASAAVHASNSGWLDNPLWHLVKVLNAIAPDYGNGILQRVAMPSTALPWLHALAETFDAAAELRFRNSQRFSQSVHGLPAHEQLSAVLTALVLNLSDIRTVPPGLVNAIPSGATARFDLRMPPGVLPATALQTMQDRIDTVVEMGDQSADYLQLALGDGYGGYRFESDDFGVQALLDVYANNAKPAQVWPWAPGCAPAYAFAAVAPAFLIAGLGRGGNAHGVNEFILPDALARCQASITDWLLRVAAA